MNAATRQRTSKCPSAPAGIPDVNYMSLPSIDSAVNPAEILLLRDVASEYCQRSLPAHAEWPVRSSWELDPLADFPIAVRLERDRIFAGWRTLVLTEQYKKLRELTHLLIQVNS